MLETQHHRDILRETLDNYATAGVAVLETVASHVFTRGQNEALAVQQVPTEHPIEG